MAANLWIDWDGDGAFDADEDAFPDVIGPIRCGRGRGKSGRPYEPSTAGILEFTLLDEAKYASSSPLRAGIQTGDIRIKVRLDLEGVAVWSGVLSALNPDRGANRAQRLRCKAAGVITILEQTELTGYTLTGSATTRARMLAMMPSEVSATIPASMTQTLPEWYPDAGIKSVLDGLRALEEASLSYLYEDASGGILVQPIEVREQTKTPAYDVGTAKAFDFAVLEDLRPVANTMSVPVMEYGADPAETVVDIAMNLSVSGTVDLPVQAPLPGVTSWVAVTLTETGGVTGVVQSSDIRTATIRLSGTGTVTRLQVTGTPIIADGDVKIFVQDSNSVSAYGERRYPNPPWAFSQVEDLVAYAAKKFQLLAEPLPRIKVGLYPDSTLLTAIVPGALGRVIDDVLGGFIIFTERVEIETDGYNHRLTVYGSLGDVFISSAVLNGLTALDGTFKLA